MKTNIKLLAAKGGGFLKLNRKRLLLFVTGVVAVGALIGAAEPAARAIGAHVAGLPGTSQLQQALIAAPATGGEAGGLFHGTRMWAAVVDREGNLTAVTTSTSDPTQVWPGSQSIAKAKANTANAFSLDSLALSTAQLYTFTQPGHSLASLGQANPFDPKALASPFALLRGDSEKLQGGMIFFGGGVPLYKNGKIIGGLGVSGDTSSCDHEIAKRVRDLLGLNPPGGPLVDDISYSSVDGASVFTHPLSLNTYRNGVFIGTELPAAGY
jgi:uncharacterized protein GlcG (DUF336 family)